MRRLLSFLNTNTIWSIGLYIEKNNFSFNQKINFPVKVFNLKKIWTTSKCIHTYADPFLYFFKDELFLFFESKSFNDNGKIEVIKTRDLKHFVFLGVVLEKEFHLSYPFVFEFNSAIYMIPESVKAKEIALYKFGQFPNELKKARVLLSGEYFDSSFIEHNGVWFLFTTTKIGLNIFFTNDIENGTLTPHPCNPITTDMKFSRYGGQPVLNNNIWYRIAQDCSKEYGQNINIMRINKLTETEYNEELVNENYFENKEKWNSLGGHHLSSVNFNGNKIIAVDGKQPDYLINNFLYRYYMGIKMIRTFFANI